MIGEQPEDGRSYERYDKWASHQDAVIRRWRAFLTVGRPFAVVPSSDPAAIPPIRPWPEADDAA